LAERVSRVSDAVRAPGILDSAYRLVSIGACALIVIAAFEQLAVTTVMPAIARDLDGLALYALAFAGPLASGVIGMVLAGDWSDRRGPVKALFAAVALFGIGLGALFAYRASQSGGSEEDVARAVFTPGLIYNGVYAVVIVLTILVGWPIVGFLVGSVTGDPTAWHRDKAMVKLCSQLTWVLAIPCVIRVAVQLPLWLDHQIGLLGASKIALGWPLQLASFAVMAWLLSRNRTPIEVDDR
jgi:MFS family permease